MSWLYSILIGAAAGYLAGRVMKGSGFGAIINILLGIAGAVVGGWAFGILGLASSGGTIGTLIVSFVGAVIILFVADLFKGKPKA
ncbi:MAG: GlsB/YeaQ/YmgE family stress response membrane protein [Bacteroidota bacterium]